MEPGSRLPIKTAAGYFKSEAEPDKGIGPLFPLLKAVSLGLQKLFLPLRHTDGTSEDITLSATAATALPPPQHAEQQVATHVALMKRS